MTKRTYQQYCPLALALETVGERWSLLIVRELLGGPKRYTDLREGLGAVSPTLLAARLGELEEAGVVEKQDLPPPAARTVYALTEEGRGLAPVLAGLTRWGMRRLPEPGGLRQPRPVMTARTALLAYARPFPAADGETTYEVRVDDQPFTFVFAGGAIELRDGPPLARPDLRATATAADLIRLRQGTLSPRKAIRYQPRDRSRITRFEEAFGLTRS
jgi:DNA-binding HxlR family transcriptional regulator